MNTKYEIIIIDSMNYSEVIIFKSNSIFHDSNDIVAEAIEKGFIGEVCKKNVWIARGYIENE